MHKKIALTLLAGLLSLTMLAGCGDKKDDGNKDTSSNSSSQGSSSAPVADFGDLGDYHVAVKEYRIVKDYEDKDAIIVTYEFINNGEDAIAFGLAINHKAFQNGIQLSTAIVTGDELYTGAEDQLKDVQKGGTHTVQHAYLLSDLENEVTVELTQLISLTQTEKVQKTFDIAAKG